MDLPQLLLAALLPVVGGKGPLHRVHQAVGAPQQHRRGRLRACELRPVFLHPELEALRVRQLQDVQQAPQQGGPGPDPLRPAVAAAVGDHPLHARVQAAAQGRLRLLQLPGGEAPVKFRKAQHQAAEVGEVGLGVSHDLLQAHLRPRPLPGGQQQHDAPRLLAAGGPQLAALQALFEVHLHLVQHNALLFPVHGPVGGRVQPGHGEHALDKVRIKGPVQLPGRLALGNAGLCAEAGHKLLADQLVAVVQPVPQPLQLLHVVPPGQNAAADLHQVVVQVRGRQGLEQVVAHPVLDGAVGIFKAFVAADDDKLRLQPFLL